MAPKLDLPALSGPLTHGAVDAWLNGCADVFEMIVLLDPNAASIYSPHAQILIAGLKMTEPTASAWWNEHRDDLKGLATWTEFTQRVRDRFIPAGWRLVALERFYTISQGYGDFLSFVAALQAARIDLAGAGAGFTVSDSIMKNHLFFHAQSRLRLRVLSSPGFKYENLKVDGLINLMQTTYLSLVAEGVIRPALVPVAGTASSVPRSSLPELTPVERERLRSAGGCFHCRLTPSSANWKPHSARNCPGDPAKGVPPRNVPFPSSSRVAAVTVDPPASPPRSCILTDDDLPQAIATVRLEAEPAASSVYPLSTGDDYDYDSDESSTFSYY